MRLLRRSIQGRLLALSALTTILALAVAAFAIGHVLERFVIRGLDQQLDTEAAMLARAVRPDGMLDPARVIDLPMFAGTARGWGWRVDGPGGHWARGDRLAASRGSPPYGRHHGPPPPEAVDRGVRPAGATEGGLYPGEGVAISGEPVHVRMLILPRQGGAVTVTVGGPRRLALAPLREAMAPLIGSLAILGVALALATVVQLRIGLWPLRRLRADLGEVRAGRARYVPGEQPDELAPLAAELNGLIDGKDAQLEQARRHVANLAHGLKTPLAALTLRLAENGRDPDGALAAIVADIDGRVRHHLGRARAAAPGGGHPVTALQPALADLIAVMRGIHAERGVEALVEVGSDAAVAADPQDLDEMLGNLLDNAWRHARSRVTVAAYRKDATIEIAIEDDGAGLSPEEIAAALVPGRRLDERGDGHGFGLPIALELAELNGGNLALGRAPGGGLQATLILPSNSG